INAKSRFELLFRLLDEPAALQHGTVAVPCGEIVGVHTNHVSEIGKVILPNPIVTDAKQRGSSQDPSSKQVLQAFVWKGGPCDTCQECYTESGCIQKPFRKNHAGRQNPI